MEGSSYTDSEPCNSMLALKPAEAATSASSPRSHILRIDRAWLGHVLAIAAA